MDVFHVFKYVQMSPNGAKRHKYAIRVKSTEFEMFNIEIEMRSELPTLQSTLLYWNFDVGKKRNIGKVARSFQLMYICAVSGLIIWLNSFMIEVPII